MRRGVRAHVVSAQGWYGDDVCTDLSGSNTIGYGCEDRRKLKTAGSESGGDAA